MKIVTWNVNSLKSRKGIVKEWLEYNQADFLLLQEIKGCVEEEFTIFKDMGYNFYSNLQKTYNGVATLTKHNCLVTKKEIPSYVDTQARFLEILYDDILIINCYMPNGNPINTEKYTYKLEWLYALYNYVAQLVLENKNFIIAGDFNIAPRNIDVYSEKAFANDALVQKEVRDIYYSLINLGLLDVIDYQYKSQKKIYTWWDYRNTSFARNNGARIDHILLSPLLSDKYIGATIDKNPRIKEKPSDHTPVLCELQF